MRAVVHVCVGVVELNYMWLPTWIGMNVTLMKELGTELKDYCAGEELNEALLDKLHAKVIDTLCQKYENIQGLRSYLEALSAVKYG